MRHGYVRAAAITPKIRVADPLYNKEVICEKMEEAVGQGAAVLVFPELCITGYTCGDLFWQELLLNQAKEQLLEIAACTKGKNCIAFVGLPLMYNGKLYNVAAALGEGRVLGLVPKTFIPMYNEFYEGRYFTPGMEEAVLVELPDGSAVPMGSRLLFACRQMPELKIAAEICEDLWAPMPPSTLHGLAGANLIVNLSASEEVTGKEA